LRGQLTPACGALWQPIYDALAQPMPATDGAVDPRRPGQRLHDAHEEAARRLLRADLPDCGGVPTTALITMTIEDLLRQAGTATTGHGDPITVRQALDLAGDGQFVGVVIDANGGVLDYGRARRIVPAAMRMALITRDGGCTFPGCDRPPAWTQLITLLTGPTVARPP
jgi:Domain of unknown function (DUF222)